MKQIIDSLLVNLALILVLLNTVLYLKSFKTYKNNSGLKYFSFYLLASSIISISTIYLASIKSHNLYFSHFYFIIQFVALSLFYKSILLQAQKKWINLTLIIVLVALMIQYALNPTIFFRFNSFEIFITSFPLVIYSIVHLFNSINKKGVFMLINSGILIYLTSSSLIFILGNYLASSKGTMVENIWLINKVIYVVYLSLILLEWKNNFLQAKKKS